MYYQGQNERQDDVMAKKEDRVYTAEMGQPPLEDDMSAAPTPKPAPKPAPTASAPKPKPKPAPKRKDKPVEYKGYTPVDDPITMAKGGRVTRGDGCAKRGHTKGKNR